MFQTLNMRYSKHKVRSTPMVHIHTEDKEKITQLASDMKLMQFEALRIILKAGFDAIENKTTNLQQIREELAV